MAALALLPASHLLLSTLNPWVDRNFPRKALLHQHVAIIVNGTVMLLRVAFAVFMVHNVEQM